jgi:hypothetical protein
MTQVIHPAASAEVIEALDYYEAIESDLSEQFFACVEDYRKRISADPLLFRIRAHGVRRVNLAPQFNEWYLAYLIWNDRVVILALGHAKMRPFYFRRRIGEARKMV